MNSLCFNPHTHAGCDLQLSGSLCPIPAFQSTHPRRVWLIGKLVLVLLVIGFNPHTHAGCDCFSNYFVSLWYSFNPHTHAGCDACAKLAKAVSTVSIHTPTQGVTQPLKDRLIVPMFQSTHPRRVWPNVINRVNSKGSFNPHTHAGCDWGCERAGIHGRVSIHTPTQGVTIMYLIFSLSSAGFNPHTHAGCDFWFIDTFLIPICFNPHTHAGCDADSIP